MDNLNQALSPAQRAILAEDLASNRESRLSTAAFRKAVARHGLASLEAMSDTALLLEAYRAGLPITLADAGFDKLADATQNRLIKHDDWYASLCVGSSVYWVDPEEEAARNTILEYHDMSLEFWDSLSLDAMTELAREAGMSWPFSSGIYRIAMIASDSGVIESNDSIVMLMNEDGSLVEAHPSELRPADSQPGVASRPHREASAAHVDMRQTSAPAPAQ